MFTLALKEIKYSVEIIINISKMLLNLCNILLLLTYKCYSFEKVFGLFFFNFPMVYFVIHVLQWIHYYSWQFNFHRFQSLYSFYISANPWYFIPTNFKMIDNPQKLSPSIYMIPLIEMVQNPLLPPLIEVIICFKVKSFKFKRWSVKHTF